MALVTVYETQSPSWSQRGISFSETAAAGAALGYIIAFLILLSAVKLWPLLRLNPQMNMITSALRRAWGDISGFVVIILIMLLAYTIAVSGSFGKTSRWFSLEAKASQFQEAGD